jgi:hypothetical protein
LTEMIRYTTMTERELGTVSEMIGTAVIGMPENHIVMGCLSMILFLQYPDITKDEMVRGLKDVSEWITLYLSTLSEKTDPAKVN